MTKRMSRAERRAATSTAKAAHGPMFDSFQNVAARLGIGTDNLSSASAYAFNPITRQRVQLDYMYRGSWLVGQAVDCVADDLFRAGIDITGDADPSDIDKVQGALVSQGVWAGLTNTARWGRLYGGAGGVILIEGQDLSKPLRQETVARDQFKGVYPVDRWGMIPVPGDTVREFGPNLGKPGSYQITVDVPGIGGQVVHHTRVIRFDGIDLPYWQRTAEMGWGMSVVERLYDRLVAFDSTTQGAAQLVYKAHLRTVKVKDLRSILAAGGAPEAAMTKQFEMIRVMQSNEGLTLLDAEDQFETHSYTFAGLSDVLGQFAQQLSGALQIPLVRLFGQSPAGFSTGDADIRNYYDMIRQQQETRLHAPISVLVDLVYRSTVGKAPPENLGIAFNPLWQMSEKERAEVTTAVTASVVAAEEAGLVTKATALRELRQSADVTGVWSNISDEEIEAAENEPPPAPEMGEGEDGDTPPPTDDVSEAVGAVLQ